jgi:hypothetical protein
MCQQELMNHQALLTKARNAYIADLKILLNGGAGPMGEPGGKLGSPPNTTTLVAELTDPFLRFTGLLDEE